MGGRGEELLTPPYAEAAPISWKRKEPGISLSFIPQSLDFLTMTPEEILRLVTEIIVALTRGAVAVADIISAYKEKRRRRREARAAAHTPAAPTPAAPTPDLQVCSHLHSN